MSRLFKALVLTASAAAVLLSCGAAVAAVPEGASGPLTAKDWADLAKLPDWSGVWNPDFRDEVAQEHTNPPPWTPAVARQVDAMHAEEKAGHPRGPFVNCLPEGTPSWMLISHNAMEILFTPGRVTLLGESDGNRLRRIYTDGRAHSGDPDPSFHGESIGRWEGDTLVVDTIGVLPQALLAVSESVAIPNNGDLHVTERLHLVAPDILHDDLEISAPHVLTAPWKTTRTFYRQRGRKFEIVEGECLQGDFAAQADKDGNAIFVLQSQDQGNIVPPGK